MSSLINSLYKTTGSGNYLLGIRDITIQRTNGTYQVSGTTAEGKAVSVQAERVITTVGAYNLPALLPFLKDEQMNKISSLLYTKIVEVPLGFKIWKGMTLDGFGGLIPYRENHPILGILFMSAILSGKAPAGGALFAVMMGGARNPGIIGKPDTEITAIVENESKKLLGIPDFNPDLLEIIRHSHAIPQYGADSGERFQAIKKIEEKYPGLIIAGNCRNGIGMADRIQQAKDIVDGLV